MAGGEIDMHDHSHGAVDEDVAGGGPVLDAVEGILEGDIVVRAVVNADTSSRVVNVLHGTDIFIRASSIRMRKYKGTNLFRLSTILYCCGNIFLHLF